MVLTDKLTAIGDAIREMTGGSEPMTLDAMPDAIRGIETGGGSESGFPSKFTLSGGSSGAIFSGETWTFLLENPLEITLENGSYGIAVQSGSANLGNLTLIVGNRAKLDADLIKQVYIKSMALPTIYYTNTDTSYKCYSLANNFYLCRGLQEIPDDFYKYKDTSGNILTDVNGSEYWTKGFALNSTFYSCNSLRKVNCLPPTIGGGTYSVYNSAFYECYHLNEVTLPVCSETLTSNMFSSYTFNGCHCLRKVVFATQADGTPYTANWQGQELRFGYDKYNNALNVGFASSQSNILHSYNVTFTTDTQITDDATYAALKDNPDRWTLSAAYSQFNYASAKELINSLPDCSAYLASSGGTRNIVNFRGGSGASTDEGPISNLTEEEIAVATAKGWDIQLV